MQLNRNKWQGIHHYVVAFYLFTKGIDKLGHSALLGSFCLLSALFILYYSLRHAKDHHKKHHLDLWVHVIEALVLWTLAVSSYYSGKTYIHLVQGIAAIGFTVAVVVHVFKLRR